MKKFQSIGSRASSIVLLFFILIIWQIVVDSGYIERYILPSPIDIIRALIEILPKVWGHIFVTVIEAFIGFIIAIVLALLLAIVMDIYIPLKEALYPILLISQTIPIIALAPLFAMWFGFGILPKIIVVILVCFFPIVISLLNSFEAVDLDLIYLMKSMGASKFQTFQMVKLPYAMIGLFSGLKISATYSIMGAVIGEWLGGKEGVGVYMLRVKHSYAYDKVFAVILIIIFLSMLVFFLVLIFERVLMPWNTETKVKK